MSDWNALGAGLEAATLGRLSALKNIGGDARPAVFSAYDSRLNREVTLVVVGAGAPGSRSVDDMARSAQAAAWLRHEAIAEVLDLQIIEERLVVQCERVDGETLRELMRDREAWPEPVIRLVLLDLMAALEFAHARGAVHGDLGSASILVTADGGICLVGFGLSPNVVERTAQDDRASFTALEAELYDALVPARDPPPMDRRAIDDARAMLAGIVRDWRAGTRLPLGVGAGGPTTSSPPQPSPAFDENVQFTVYRPAVVRPAEWQPLLAFAHLSEARPGSTEPDPIELVEGEAHRILGERMDEFQKLVQDTSQAVPREGTITFVPEMAGVDFNPPRQSFQWVESVHRADFRLRASSLLDGKTARGRMTVYYGAIILAELSLSIRVDSSHRSLTPTAEPVQARPYRKIFASYSHKDIGIVRQFELYASTLGDRYLRDATDLRAGEVWSDGLERLINDADILQLFWSSNSMSSPFVRQEWEYALSLRRPNFIRPTYWESPLPRTPDGSLPPEDLLRLQFQQLPAAPLESANERFVIGSIGAAAPSHGAAPLMRGARPMPSASPAPQRSVEDIATRAVPASPPRRSRRPRTTLATAAAVLIAAIGLSVFMKQCTGGLPTTIGDPTTEPPALAVRSLDQVTEAFRQNETEAHKTYDQRYIAIDVATVARTRADTTDTANVHIDVTTARGTVRASGRAGGAMATRTLSAGARMRRLVCRVDASGPGQIQLKDCK